MQNMIYIKRNIPVLKWAHTGLISSVAAAKSEQPLVFKSKPAFVVMFSLLWYIHEVVLHFVIHLLCQSCVI